MRCVCLVRCVCFVVRACFLGQIFSTQQPVRQIVHHDLPNGWAAVGERACLVYDGGVQAASRFPHIAASDDDAFSGSPPDTRHDSCGGCQAQSARAGHHQHGNSSGDACGCAFASQHPTDESDSGGGYDRRNEDRTGTIHQSLHGGARLLGFFQQPHDLGVGCFAAHPLGFHRQETGGVQRGSCDFIAGLHRFWDRLAGEERFVYGGVP